MTILLEFMNGQIAQFLLLASLICLSLDYATKNIRKSFKFEAVWITESSFKDIVHNATSNIYVGNSIQKFNGIISSFQYLATNQNSKVFENLFFKREMIYANLLFL